MKVITFFFCIVVSLNLIAQNPNPSADTDIKIRDIMKNMHFPGVSTLIVKNKDIVWIESYGYANTDSGKPFTDTTSLMIASVSKVFTGIALMQLVEKELITLDDNINNYLPFDISIPGYKNVPVTFRMLLTHTSSITDGDAMDKYYNWNGDPDISLAECIERYFSTSGKDYNPDDNFIHNCPGTNYEYTNMGAALEGFLVETITGIPFNQYCNENIFTPLGMCNTHWYLSEYQNMNMLANPHDYYRSRYEPVNHYGFADYPDGMLHTNVNDLAKFMIAILCMEDSQNHEILSASSIKAMFTPQIPDIEPTQGLQFYKESMNLNSGRISLWGHSGGEYGITTEMYFDPENNLGIVVLANGENDATAILKILYTLGMNQPTNVGFIPNEEIPVPAVIEKSLYYDVYPNPASDILFFKPVSSSVSSPVLVISNLSGRQLMRIKKNTREIKINISSLPDGMYFYTILDKTNPVSKGTFMVKH